MGLDGIPEKSPVVTKSIKNIPEVLECCPAMVRHSQAFLCSQEFSPEAWEALLKVPFMWGAMILGGPWVPRAEHEAPKGGGCPVRIMVRFLHPGGAALSTSSINRGELCYFYPKSFTSAFRMFSICEECSHSSHGTPMLDRGGGVRQINAEMQSRTRGGFGAQLPFVF